MFLGKLCEFITPLKTGKQRRPWLDSKYLSRETLEKFSYSFTNKYNYMYFVVCHAFFFL